MYFKYVPNIEYDNKPIQYPFSESDYTITKNFFRRYQVNDDVFSYAVFFKKYAIQDDERLDTIAERAYGDPFLDWVIAITNNIFNPLHDWPLSEDALRKHCESSYDDPYGGVHHYETYELKNDQGNVVLEGGLVVDESFYNSPIFRVDTESDFLPRQLTAVQATADVFIDDRISKIDLTNLGFGYETTPTINISDSSGGYGASAEALLSPCGYVKRIDVTNPGLGYVYPPQVLFGGDMEGLSATASIDENGSITEIILDGITWDTTTIDNIYLLGPGTTIAPNGTGIGTTGGFNIGSQHLRFGDSAGQRFCILKKVDTTKIDTVRVYAIRGNGSNGGETPDIVGQEDLRLQYQITTDPMADPYAWQDLGVIIDAVPNGSGTGVLDNYDFELPPELKSENVFFRLFQQANSGADYDHYGIKSVTFLSRYIEFCNPTISIVPNELQQSPVTTEATASIVLGKKVTGIKLLEKGHNYTELTTSVLFLGGNPVSHAQASVDVGSELEIVLTNPGNAYESATIELVGGDGVGAKARIEVANDKVTTVAMESNGDGYDTPPTAVISAPDNANSLNVGDTFELGELFWRYNGTNWERQVTKGYQYYNEGQIKTKPGYEISYPVSYFDYEWRKNEEKREIYILKEEYLEAFLSDFRKTNLYKKSSSYVDNKLKKSAK